MKNLHPLLRCSPELLKDLFITAAEGGSNYWASFKVGNPDVLFYDIYHPEWYVIVEEKSEEGHTLSTNKIAFNHLNDGFYKLTTDEHYTSKKRLSDVLTDNYDAEDADVWFQYAVNGEVKYG